MQLLGINARFMIDFWNASLVLIRKKCLMKEMYKQIYFNKQTNKTNKYTSYKLHIKYKLHIPYELHK